MKYCILVPHYNHIKELEKFLPDLLSCGYPLVVVDDGSDADQKQQLQDIVSGNKQIHFHAHTHNRGKGAAIHSGLVIANFLGYSHAIQVDADGQHCLQDLERLMSQSRAAPETVVCGAPVFDASVPAARRYGRLITTVFVALETLSLTIKDALCGFRVYPVKVTLDIGDRYYLGPRMDYDTELLVKLCWAGYPIVFEPVRVTYPEGAASHFRYLRDNLALIRLHARLLAGAVIRFPKLVWLKFNGGRNG